MRTQTICLALAIVLICPYAVAQTIIWTQTNGPYDGANRASCSSVAARPAGRVFAGCWSINGLFVSTDNGSSWSLTPLEPLPTARFVQILAVDVAGDLFAGTQGGLYRSTDEGDSWTWAGTAGADMFRAFAASTNGSWYAASGSSYSRAQIFRSTDSGQTWTRIYFANPPPQGYPYIQFSAMACDDSGRVWASISTGILESTNYGVSWPAMSYPPQTIRALIVAQGGIVLAGGTRGVFRSTDHGIQWSQSNAGLLDTLVNAFAANGSDHVFAGTSKGVYRSTDAGLHWTPADTGITGYAVLALFVDGDGFAYAGTQGGGVFRTTASTLSISEDHQSVPVTDRLYQNYPNPFNPSTTIKFDLPRASLVSLEIYDILGREVSVLVNERRDAGVHEVKFDGSNLASGIYFYRLQSGDFVATKRLLLLK